MRKRRRDSSSDHLPFTDAQRSILLEAAASLREAKPDLSAALCQMVSRCADLPIKLIRKPKQNSGSQRSQSTTMAEKLPILNLDAQSSGKSAPFVPTNQQSGSGSISNQHTVPFFSAMLPKQIAQCFASLVPAVCEPSASEKEINQLGNISRLFKNGL